MHSKYAYSFRLCLYERAVWSRRDRDVKSLLQGVVCTANMLPVLDCVCMSGLFGRGEIAT
ncbi:hypothetical protein PPEP_a1162 [Pseudoalteromonas peptidolytica F12-50-A1]|uniref:Uncharacterized protein n=1 Tax=Pseudoalteromonas peptidolytica F12-50-A1 TaxID=1315280 RepID=A0A8I0T4F0_9GAMM|nr:hypothetical protein [Pseudoalteromonas peptidolytica F12-50-A1]